MTCNYLQWLFLAIFDYFRLYLAIANSAYKHKGRFLDNLRYCSMTFFLYKIPYPAPWPLFLATVQSNSICVATTCPEDRLLFVVLSITQSIAKDILQNEEELASNLRCAH